VELGAAFHALELFREEPLNLICDSEYVVKVLQHIPSTFLKEISQQQLFEMFVVSLQTALQLRKHPLFVTRVRSHITLPGHITEGNAVADSYTVATVHFQSARASHAFFHQNAASLKKMFDLTLEQARDIVRYCPECQGLITSSSSLGVNP
ncbi:POK18 protein, partial [Alopecoenas beccarii]|nr:POK18 protein [Alopecoenas beccarii]